MHTKLLELWSRLTTQRGSDSAVADADTGRAWNFAEIDHAAAAYLQAIQANHAVLPGQVWCLGIQSRIDWLITFLAAVKAGVVVMPIESTSLDLLRRSAKAQGASLLFHDNGMETLAEPRVYPGKFLIKLTSGTTGQPKALPFTLEEMMTDGRQIMETMSIGPEDINYVMIPLGHSYGMGNLVMPFLMAGVQLVFGSMPFPQVMSDEIRRYGCTVFALVPPLVKALASVGLEVDDLASLRLILSAGSVLSPDVARAFLEKTGKSVHNFYGSTETGGICFDREGNAVLRGNVGLPMEGVSVTVETDGSIRVASAAVCHALHADGTCLLHDFGEWDVDGSLRLTGRHEDVIKIAGRRLSLLEIEQAVCALDAVQDAYVVARPGGSGELRCICLFVGDLHSDDLRAQLLERLPKWKVPKSFHSVERIPYTARGKKDRKRLAEMVDAISQ